VTDANLLLGRLIPEYFPKIFGKSENEPLDVDASRRAFEKLAQNINENSANEFTLDEIIYGYVSRNTRNSTSESA
jgi:5-oxoprolinase (ATP-hydrolysing)